MRRSESPEAVEERGGSELPVYLVRFGWCNENTETYHDFGTALGRAVGLLASMRLGKGVERPTIRGPNADEDTDGLSDEERGACEAAGLEVTRP